LYINLASTIRFFCYLFCNKFFQFLNDSIKIFINIVYIGFAVHSSYNFT